MRVDPAQRRKTSRPMSSARSGCIGHECRLPRLGVKTYLYPAEAASVKPDRAITDCYNLLQFVMEHFPSRFAGGLFMVVYHRRGETVAPVRLTCRYYGCYPSGARVRKAVRGIGLRVSARATEAVESPANTATRDTVRRGVWLRRAGSTSDTGRNNRVCHWRSGCSCLSTSYTVN